MIHPLLLEATEVWFSESEAFKVLAGSGLQKDLYDTAPPVLHSHFLIVLISTPISGYNEVFFLAREALKWAP